MPQSMLSTSSVHSTVSLPPVLPATGAPPPEGFSSPVLDPPPPQPVRTAPASASAMNAPLTIRSIEVPSSGGPRRLTNVGHRSSRARERFATRDAVAARKRCLRATKRRGYFSEGTCSLLRTTFQEALTGSRKYGGLR